MPPILPTIAPRSSDTNIGALQGDRGAQLVVLGTPRRKPGRSFFAGVIRASEDPSSSPGASLDWR